MSLLSLDTLPQQKYALFLDFDGTLVPLSYDANPNHLVGQVKPLLQTCIAKNDNAVAIVTGRAVENIKTILPLALYFVGQHGLEFANPQGEYKVMLDTSADINYLMPIVTKALAQHNLPATSENKEMSLAIYYPNHPEIDAQVQELVQNILDSHNTSHKYVLQLGKHIVEVKAKGFNKGKAITELMKSPPFAGRVPIFFGDDITDEDGFEAVNALNGVSVKVGPGATKARYRTENTESVIAWLNATYSC